jgi:hypothetical protein
LPRSRHCHFTSAGSTTAATSPGRKVKASLTVPSSEATTLCHDGTTG